MPSLNKPETKNSNISPEYLQESECAVLFGVSTFFLRKLRYQGRIPAASINGRMILYPVAEVRAFFKRATTIGAKSTCGVWTAKRAPRKARAVKQEGLK